MPATATGTIVLYRRYRLTDADGAESFVEILPDLAASIAALDAELERREESHEARHVNFTDLTPFAARHADGDHPKPRRPPRPQYTKPGEWEGPRVAFHWLVGESAVWSGPGGQRLVRADGADAGCRFCGHMARLPAAAVCLGCHRSGVDRHPEVARARPKTPDPKPRNPDGLKGGAGATRRARRKGA